MADNIKIVGNIISTTTVPRYNTEDSNLIPSKKLSENFGGTGDYIEFYIYDIAGNLLNSQYNYLNYKLPSSTGLTPGTTTTPNTTGNIQTENVGVVSTLSPTTSSLYPVIEIDPVQDLQNAGYSSGEFNVRYNLFKNIFSDYINEALFIKEISPDRTEIRLASTTLTNDQIESGSLALINEINNADYYVDYLLNFGNNEQYVAVNVALNKAPEGYEILFKLYDPLPLSVQEKMTLWVVEEKTLPYVFDINLDKFIIPAPGPTLRGPNFNIPISSNQGTVASTYNTYYNLVSSLKSLQSSSYNQIVNLLATQSIDINVDYTNFNNFIFFGSAYQRVTNFYTKAKQIENYKNLINKYTPYVATTSSLQLEINKYSSSIETIISQFDGYESYLYFESSSYTWPKTNSTKPFSLLPTGSAITITWYNNQKTLASSYDLNNYDNLEYAIPVYLKDDTNNAPFLLFLNMVGQYFDNIWIYLKAVTDVNLANNNLDYGISKDLVYERLKSLGLHLYNTQAGESVAQYLVGSNTGSSTWDNNTTITGSYLNNIPRKDLVSELYKRIYHNLPLLLKQKGTVEGLDTLMTVFGIPNKTYYTVGSESFYFPTGSSVTASILNVKEFGGSLKSNLTKGYNNDKVRIVSNTIVPGATGSVLSPILSLQTSPTSTTQFRDNDMNYIDISFSPQTQIDTYASKSIASNNPTWSLDDYIGDPRQQYNSSYPDLDTQRKLYYQTGVSGFPGFTGSLLDYNGFIRLIQYFDNSLFKMLEDFVPERTSLSTGVTINSPVLERNKVSYANPTTSTTQSVYNAEYSASTISSTYGNFYNALSSSNNTMGWYDGELSGSIVNVNQYFTDNYNPYLGDWNVYNAQHNPTQSIDQNSFIHSDFNVLLNNVFKNVQSKVRQQPNYVPSCTTYLIGAGGKPGATWQCILCGDSIPTLINVSDTVDSTVCSSTVPLFVGGREKEGYPKVVSDCSTNFPTFAELQDSYLTLRSYQTSRYEGSKTTSKLYNTYTYPSGAYEGDKSYGTTAAIDRYSRKIGIFTQIETSSILPKRNNVSLKYLVDEFGSLTELNLQNKHWEDVQRTFVKNTTASVALFDNKKNSNQKLTDGNKVIFDSGYAYYPIFYIGEGGEKLYFESDNPSNYLARASNLTSSGNYYIKGGPGGRNDYAPISSGGNTYVRNLYNNIIEDGTNRFLSSSFQRFYTVAETGDYFININGYISATFLPIRIPASASFTFTLKTQTTTISSNDVVPTYTGFDENNNNNTVFSTWYFGASPYKLSAGDVITASLQFNFTSSNNVTLSLSPGNFQISSLSNAVGNYPYTTAAISNFDVTASISSSYNTLVFNKEIYNFYKPNYVFRPQGSGSYSSSLYNNFINEVNDLPFQLGQGDIFYSVTSTGLISETLVQSVIVDNDNGKVFVYLVSPFNPQLFTDIEAGVGKSKLELVFLRQVPDETNINLRFPKRPGLTSYGFLLPGDLAPDIIKNIDTITSQVKTKLLADQQGTTIQ
jgi:hypothetical protein